MGCGNPKCVVKHKKSIELISCHNQRIDELFEPAKTRIAILKSVLKDLKYSELILKHLTFTHIIRDSSLTDCIMSFLLFLASSSDSAIQYFEIKFMPISPYISLKREKLTIEQNSILEAWINFLKTLNDSEQKLLKLEKEFENIIKDLPNTETTSKGICNNTEMDTHEAANILKSTLLNLRVINSQPHLIRKSLENINLMKDKCYRLYSDFKQEKLDEILKIGDEIKKSGAQGVRSIILRFWPEKEKIDLSLETTKRIKIDYKTHQNEEN